jgi:hypothetical protein
LATLHSGRRALHPASTAQKRYIGNFRIPYILHRNMNSQRILRISTRNSFYGLDQVNALSQACQSTDFAATFWSIRIFAVNGEECRSRKSQSSQKLIDEIKRSTDELRTIYFLAHIVITKK